MSSSCEPRTSCTVPTSWPSETHTWVSARMAGHARGNSLSGSGTFISCSLLVQNGHPRQLTSFQKLQRCSTTRRDVTHPVGQVHLFDRGDGISSPHYRLCPALRQDLGHSARPLGSARNLEHTHR